MQYNAAKAVNTIKLTYSQRGISLRFITGDDDRRAEVFFRPPVLFCIFLFSAIQAIKD